MFNIVIKENMHSFTWQIFQTVYEGTQITLFITVL